MSGFARFVRFFVLALILVSVAVGSAVTAMRFAIHGREVKVPKLTGLTMQQAESIALESGLVVEVENRFYSNELPAGHVLSQLPAPGSEVRRGWSVRVALSLGKPSLDVPDLTGQSPRAAQINVGRRGLQIGSIAEATLPAQTAGLVIAQNPSPHTGEVSTPKINLLTAIESPQAYIMPSLLGRRIADVTPELEAAGMEVGSVGEEMPAPAPTPAVANAGASPSANSPATQQGAAAVPSAPVAPPAARAAPRAAPDGRQLSGLVIVRQVPAPGQKVSKGTRVSLFVAR